MPRQSQDPGRRSGGRGGVRKAADPYPPAKDRRSHPRRMKDLFKDMQALAEQYLDARHLAMQSEGANHDDLNRYPNHRDAYTLEQIIAWTAYPTVYVAPTLDTDNHTNTRNEAAHTGDVRPGVQRVDDNEAATAQRREENSNSQTRQTGRGASV